MGDWKMLYLMFIGLAILLELDVIRKTLHSRLNSIEDLLELASNIGPEDRDDLREMRELRNDPRMKG